MAENLPDVPREKLTLFQRLSSKEYEEAMKKAMEFQANLEQVMAAANETEAALNQREEEMAEKAKAKEAELAERAKAKEAELAERAALLDKREAKIAERENAITEREADFSKRVTEAEATIASKAAETSKKADAVGVEKNEFEAEKMALIELLNKVATKDGADQELIAGVMTMLEKLRPEKTTEKVISQKSLSRDDIVMQTIMAIQQQARNLDHATKLKVTQGMTFEEREALNLQKANLRAALIATVCLYRDSLPEVDRLTLSINGKSCAVFLQEQAKAITEETKNHKVSGGLQISQSALEMIDTTYKHLAQALNFDAKSDKSSSYEPFHPNLGITDNRRAGTIVFEKCLSGANRGLDLVTDDKRRAKAKIARATTDITAPSSLESEITGTAKIVEEDWEK